MKFLLTACPVSEARSFQNAVFKHSSDLIKTRHGCNSCQKVINRQRNVVCVVLQSDDGGQREQTYVTKLKTKSRIKIHCMYQCCTTLLVSS